MTRHVPLIALEGSNFYENMITLERTLGLGAQVADIERVRQILGQDKLTLVGHSYGGFIATLYAAEFPDHVDKLVLVSPAGVLTPPDEERNLFELARTKLDASEQNEFDALIEEYLDFANIFSKSDDDLVDVHSRTGQYLLSALGYDASEIAPGPAQRRVGRLRDVFQCWSGSGLSPGTKRGEGTDTDHSR